LQKYGGRGEIYFFPPFTKKVKRGESNRGGKPLFSPSPKIRENLGGKNRGEFLAPKKPGYFKSQNSPKNIPREINFSRETLFSPRFLDPSKTPSSRVGEPH